MAPAMPALACAVPRAAQRRASRAALAAALACAAALLHASANFVAAPGGILRAASGADGTWVASSPRERMEESRGQALPRTQLRGAYAQGDRSRKNQQGGGRLPIRVSRNPVIAYTINDEKASETSGSVLRRMWNMYDMDFNKMTFIRDRYFRQDPRKYKWTADYNMRLGKRKKLNRLKRQCETDWQQWMRTNGRQQGLTEPVIFNGPPLAGLLTKELDDASEPKAVGKALPASEDIKVSSFPKGAARLPVDVQPGQWNTDGPDNIFKIWKRPLHKHPYDIGKRGKRGPVVRGIVF